LDNKIRERLSFSTSSKIKHIAMGADQRKYHRLGLRLPVWLSRRNGEHPIASETLNISTEGFYCTTSEPFAPGERLRCRISLPDDRTSHKEAGLYLDADVEVLRVTVTAQRDSGFGIACRIREYRLLPRHEAESGAAL
jgi:hypothetical protein